MKATITGALGSARAQYHLRQIFVFMNALIVNRPEVMIGSAATRFDEQGNLVDEATREIVRTLLVSLADWTRRLQGQGQRAISGPRVSARRPSVAGTAAGR